MLKDLVRRLTAGLVAAVMAAAAAGIVLVAAAFATYAALKLVVSPAAASALTALLFAAVVGLIAVVAPRVIRGKSTPAPSRRLSVDPNTIHTASQIGAAVLGIVSEMALSRRLKRQD